MIINIKNVIEIIKKVIAAILLIVFYSFYLSLAFDNDLTKLVDNHSDIIKERINEFVYQNNEVEKYMKDEFVVYEYEKEYFKYE